MEFETTLIRELFEVEVRPGREGLVDVLVLPRVQVEVDFSRYPKRPNVRLPRELERIVGKPRQFLLSLSCWDRKAPFHVVTVLEELRNHVENVAGVKIRILKHLAEGLCQHAHHYHPREFLGLLRVRGGVLAEYLLPPGMQSSGNSAIFYSSRLPVDRSVIASVHSHPSGNASPSREDLHMFSHGTNFFNLIIGYPYSLADIVVYDRRGNRLPLEIVERTPFEVLGEEDPLDEFLSEP
ncbi:MAG: Mov34/MPN/PAD-1 family protein [Promethearchaeota archaeon]